jgi:hypothetical protein
MSRRRRGISDGAECRELFWRVADPSTLLFVCSTTIGGASSLRSLQGRVAMLPVQEVFPFRFPHPRIPFFANRAKDGAPAVLALPARSQAERLPRYFSAAA